MPPKKRASIADGLRFAMGAQPQEVATQVIARPLWMLFFGAVAGLALSLASVRGIEPLLYQVQPTAVLMLLIPVVAVIGEAVIAVIPALIHAVKIDAAMPLRPD